MARRTNRPAWILSLALGAGVGAVFAFASPASARQAKPAEHAEAVDFKQLNAALQREMTEDQVIDLAKSKPSWASMETCGANTPQEWQCKAYHYDQYSHYKLTHEFNIYFYQFAQDVWKVSSWTFY
jgi:hypothetical protein